MTDASGGAGAPAHDHNHNHHHHHDHGDCSHHHHPLPVRPDALISARGIGLMRDGRSILQGVDLDIHPREIVTLIGPNGAGKTSLVRIMLGVLAADRGTVTRKPGLVTGYVPQRFDLDRAVPITVERFLTLSHRASRDEIARVLDEVGARDVASRQLFHLSGGELQRVLLARALIRSPDLLVLDEPSRGVDYVGEAELYDLIGRLRTTRGLGLLLVSHDLHVVMAKSDRVICLNQHVCCAGVPDRVALDPAYQQLFGLAAAQQLAVYRHHHDHAHDLAGNPKPPAVPPEA
ncbi:MAG: ATP-binding cassette domain-containing protein [Hyphomicrobiaceae bacterium]